MSDTSTAFAGDIPLNYHRYLGPVLFEDFAADLSKRLAAENPSRVLELACGSGILTKQLLADLGEAAHVTASDLNEDMLKIARDYADHSDTVTYSAQDATALTLEDDSYDAAICQFGVMFYPDKDLGYREAKRVLRDGGVFIFNTWCPPHDNPFAQTAHSVVKDIYPDDPPRFYEVPFGYGDPEPIVVSLKNAGFTDVEYEQVSIDKAVPSMRSFADGVVLGNPLILEIRERGTATPEEVTGAVYEALADAFGDNPGRIPLNALAFTARAG